MTRTPSKDELFREVVELLYQAALDDALWPDVFGAIDDLCGLKGGQLTVLEADADGNLEPSFAYAYNGREPFPDPVLDWMRNPDYVGSSANIRRLGRAPTWKPMHNEQLFTDEEKCVSAMYNEFQPKWECANQVGIVVDRPGGVARPNEVALWTMRSADYRSHDGGWQQDDMHRLEGLLPHLRQSICVRRALVSAELVSALFLVESLQSASSLGVVFLDRRGSILFMNDPAKRSLHLGDSLHDQGGNLCAHHPEDNDRLQRCLAAALPRLGRVATGTDLTLPRAGRLPLTLHVYPVPQRLSDFGASRLAAMVLIRDPETPFAPDPALIGKTLGLTRAESRVAALLAKGCAAREVATTLHRTENTVRWTLKNALARTGCSRQADLVRLVV